jgi:hypothetical protein
MCCLYVKFHKGDMWHKTTMSPIHCRLLQWIKKQQVFCSFSLSTTYEKEREENGEPLVCCHLLHLLKKRNDDNEPLALHHLHLMEKTQKKKHTGGSSSSSITIEKKKEKMTRCPWLIVPFNSEWKKKQEDDNEPNSSLSYVVTHEENKLEDDNEPGGLSSFSNLLL